MQDRRLEQAAVDFLTLVAAGRVDEAYERHVADRFRHHNPYFRGDAASLKEAMKQNAAQNPHKVLDVKLALQDGDRVAVLSHVRQRPGDLGFSVVHFFRFDGGRVVELWDVVQEVPSTSVNENGAF